MNKHTPGITAWIALVILLGFMIHTSNKIVAYVETIDIRLLELEIDLMEEYEYEEEDDEFRGWEEMEEEEKEEFLVV